MTASPDDITHAISRMKMRDVASMVHLERARVRGSFLAIMRAVGVRAFLAGLYADLSSSLRQAKDEGISDDGWVS